MIFNTRLLHVMWTVQATTTKENLAQEFKNISTNWNSYLSCPSQIFYWKKKKKITVLKNPNKDNSELKERKLEGAHCLQ